MSKVGWLVAGVLGLMPIVSEVGSQEAKGQVKELERRIEVLGQQKEQESRQRQELQQTVRKEEAQVVQLQRDKALTEEESRKLHLMLDQQKQVKKEKEKNQRVFLQVAGGGRRAGGA
jgi:aspartate oxidase